MRWAGEVCGSLIETGRGEIVSAPLRINNRDARRVWLHLQGMSEPPTGALTQAGLAGTVERLGMVQLDPLRVIARAHDHILWSRNANYRPAMLERLLAKDRLVFEHFTHDAAVLPMSIYPMWHRRKAQLAAASKRGSWVKHLPPTEERERIKARIAQEGPLSSRDFEAVKREKTVWMPQPHRLALNLMWNGGELSTSHRQNFSKFFDLTERVIPAAARASVADDAVQVDWLCRSALDRLGFGTATEVAKFYDAASIAEVRARAADTRWWRAVEVEEEDGVWSPALARPDIEDVLADAPEPLSRMRIVNPFDPIARDRARCKRLFGFDYRIEIYTPAAKRQYGYYVYPVLEGDRFVGRIEAKLDSKTGVLSLDNVWPEAGVRFGAGRMGKLVSELERMGRFSGAEACEFGVG